MELLLNLVWFFLAAVALYAWGCRLNHPQAQLRLVVLLCLLALLFPVISATDDLHAMNSEMEDSTSVRRNTKQIVAGKFFGQLITYHPPALVNSIFKGLSDSELGAVRTLHQSACMPTLRFMVRSDRAPPLINLA
jgi:hypothetical protein